MNIERAIDQGRGLSLKLGEITEDHIYNQLTELVENPKYKKNAEKISKLFKDRPITAEDSIIYWTQYVARHKGANFLKSAGNDLNFIQFYLIDVYAVLAVEFVVVMFLNFMILRMIIRKIFKKKNKKQKVN